MGILDEYKAQVKQDEEKTNNDFPQDSRLTEEKREEYEKALEKLRNHSEDMKNKFEKATQEMIKKTETELEQNSCITEEEVQKVIVKHAYCEDCGEELISKVPPMYNPFTLEKICRHTCSKCGKIYDLEFSYPRVAFINSENKEICAFTR